MDYLAARLAFLGNGGGVDINGVSIETAEAMCVMRVIIFRRTKTGGKKDVMSPKKEGRSIGIIHVNILLR